MGAHTCLSRFNVDPSIGHQVGEVVGVNDLLWDDVEAESHVFVFVKWSVEVEIGDIQCCESSQGCGGHRIE